jgi:Domain of unknown function (DUF1508)
MPTMAPGSGGDPKQLLNGIESVKNNAPGAEVDDQTGE